MRATVQNGTFRVWWGVFLLLAAGVAATVASADVGRDPRGIGDQVKVVCILVPGGVIDSVLARCGGVLDEFEDGLYLLEGPEEISGDEYVARLIADPMVLAAEQNLSTDHLEGVRMMVMGVVGGSIEEFEDQSLSDRIQLPAALLRSRGAGVVVAVLDTGVDPGHPVFAGRLTPTGLDVIDHEHYPWGEADGQDGDGDGWADDGYGHGTMVASLILLVAPEATILPIRVLDDEGRGRPHGISRGIKEAARCGADIISISFGAAQPSSPALQKLRQAAEEGVVIVAAAGNRGVEDPPFFPACAEHCVMVTALDSLDVKPDFADYHPQVVVSAPGTGVRAAWPGGDWAVGSGCSFAAPLVSGGMALRLSADPELDRSFARDLLRSGTDYIDDLPGNEPYAGKLGGGRLNLVRLLDAVPPGAEGASGADGSAYGAAAGMRVCPNPSAGSVQLLLRAGSESRGAAGYGAGAVLPVSVLDVTGRRVAEVRARPGEPACWDGRGLDGRLVPAGIYLFRIPGGTGQPARVTILR